MGKTISNFMKIPKGTRLCPSRYGTFVYFFEPMKLPIMLYVYNEDTDNNSIQTKILPFPCFIVALLGSTPHIFFLKQKVKPKMTDKQLEKIKLYSAPLPHVYEEGNICVEAPYPYKIESLLKEMLTTTWDPDEVTDQCIIPRNFPDDLYKTVNKWSKKKSAAHINWAPCHGLRNMKQLLDYAKDR
jgi:hypothetical protein